MKTLNFYDVVGKEKFDSNEYTKKTKKIKGGRMMYYAIAIAPSGSKSSRILSKEDFQSK